MEKDLYDSLRYCLHRKDLELSLPFFTHLIAKGVLTHDQTIDEYVSKHGRAVLLTLLQRKGNRGYIAFTQALYLTKQISILQTM